LTRILTKLKEDRMDRRQWLVNAAALVTAGIAGRAGAATLPEMVVYKSPTCGCCNDWVKHLRARDFTVKTVDVPDLGAIRQRFGVPDRLAACHTALVGGYVVEGHVPADLIVRLLRERPNVVGLAVPGMPAGSPGMDTPGTVTQRYQVFTFDRNGKTGVFATR
jgi:hypothetical protein